MCVDRGLFALGCQPESAARGESIFDRNYNFRNGEILTLEMARRISTLGVARCGRSAGCVCCVTLCALWAVPPAAAAARPNC